MDMENCVPPGFRFHPTEEELVGYYLKRKVNSLKFDLDVITEIDLYKMEPWDIQEKCKLGYEEQNEWYFFSHKDRKYPTGTRTNRATAAGFWKATGRDKAVVSKNKIIGMRKTLVFYKGRAPNGRKSDWIMHEYCLQTSENAPPQEEGWVVCRAFKKPVPNQRPPAAFEAYPNYYPHPSTSFRTPPTHLSHSLSNSHSTLNNFQQASFASEPHNNTFLGNTQLIDLPKLDSPTTRFNAPTDEDQTAGSKTQFLDLDANSNLLASNLNDPNLPQPYDIDAYTNHLSQFLGCFHDS